MADRYLLEDGSGGYLLENGSGLLALQASVRYLLEGSTVDGYLLEDGSGVLLLQGDLEAPAIPTRVQHVSCSSGQSNGLTSYVIELPDGSLVGNLIIVGVTWGAGTATASVADDQGQNYIPGAFGSDANQQYQLFYFPNTVAGVRKITVTFAVSSPAFVQGVASEYYNLATAGVTDGYIAASGNSGTVAPGTFNTSLDGDLIYHFGLMEVGATLNTYTAGTGFKLISADTYDGFAVQEGIQPIHGGIAPIYTVSPSNAWGSVAMAFRAARAGTAPAAGIRVIGIHHNNVQVSTNPLVLAIPTFGNLIVCSWSGNPSLGGDDISSVSDSKVNTWASSGAVVHLSSSGEQMLSYAANATPDSAMTISVSRTNPGATGTAVVFYDITGADPSPFSQRTTATGNQTVAGTITGATIVPVRQNGVIISNLGHDSRTETGISPGNFDSFNINPAPASLSPADENNGFAHEYNADTLSRTYIWSGSATAAGNWATLSVEFMGPPGPAWGWYVPPPQPQDSVEIVSY